jgi:polyisoprenoid-binding protein YceI
MRRALILVPVLGLLLVGGAFAFFMLRGGDAPPPPALPPADGPVVVEGDVTEYEVAPAEENFVGYRVREEFASFGVKDAVGRTGDVEGRAEITDVISSAEFEADLTTLASDDGRRDNALRDRAIETARFPTARFRLTAPAALGRATAEGDLTLHGETRPIRVRLESQLSDDGVELAGSARIDFADFGIEPPSVAGFVTVEDGGTLEFLLLLAPAT